MKRLALVLALVAFAAMSLVAADKTVLKFLYYADSSQAGYADDMATWAKFKAANTDIDLQMEILFDRPYAQKLTAYAAAGTVPDVVYMWPTTNEASSLLQSKKMMKDLKTVLPADFLANFTSASLDPSAQTSKQLSELPQSFTFTTVMYANVGLLKSLGLSVPKTYAELKALVPKLRVKNVQTVLLPNADKWPAQSCLFSTISGRLLGDAFIDNVLAGKAKFTDKAFVDALAFYGQLYTDGIINISNVQMGYGDGPGLFAANKAAFIIDGDWRVGAYLTDKSNGKALIDPAKQASDFELLNFVAIPGEKNVNTASAIAGTGLGINKDLSGAKLDAAKRLLMFYYGKEVQTVKLETGAFIPTRTDVTSSKLEPLSQKQIKYYSTVPKTTYVLDGALDPTVFGPLNDGLQGIPLGAQTPAEVAALMQKAQDALPKK
jgi:raffinose/stachyose/melibiose transport system substrate-binding protein